jgi:hypothetical protein
MMAVAFRILHGSSSQASLTGAREPLVHDDCERQPQAFARFTISMPMSFARRFSS